MGGHFVEDLEVRTLLSAPVRLHAASDQSSSRVIVANGIGFFESSDSKHGGELWRTDGRPEGTFMVRDITPGSTSSIIGGLTAFKSWLYFTVNRTTLSRSDGTEAGTAPVLTTTTPISPKQVIGNALYVGTANDTYARPQLPAQLWRTDGSRRGTIDLLAGTNLLGVSDLYDVRGRAYLKVETLTKQHQLWTSDGTTSGTSALMAVDDDARLLGQLRGRLFFTSLENEALNLYRSDGTASGTVKIREIVPTSILGTGGIYLFTASNGRYTFDGLPAGDYRIHEQTRTGWLPQSQRDYIVHVSVPTGAATATVGSAVTVNLAHKAAATISGSAFIDLNGNGRRDRNDPPAQLLSITATHTENGGTRRRTISINWEDEWSFAELPAGKFRLFAHVNSTRYEVEVPRLNIEVANGQAATGYQFAIRRR